MAISLDGSFFYPDADPIEIESPHSYTREESNTTEHHAPAHVCTLVYLSTPVHIHSSRAGVSKAVAKAGACLRDVMLKVSRNPLTQKKNPEILGLRKMIQKSVDSER